jgi:2-haloacid dehalogenase
VSERWATFDCYGTLVDWRAGIRAELARLFGQDDADALLERYHEVEPAIQRRRPEESYRGVLALVLAELAAERGVDLPDEERDALGSSLPRWPVFPDTRPALAEAHGRGWRLVALSNTDRDLIDASMAAIGVPFDGAVVAGEIGSYKPSPGHWHTFFRTFDVDRSHHVHVAQSHFHDIRPAIDLGIPTVWINRLGEEHKPAPTWELPSLQGLADVLDELIPPA